MITGNEGFFIGVVVARKRNFGIEVVGSGTVYVTDSVWKPFIRGVGLEASDIFIRVLFFFLIEWCIRAVPRMS